MADISNYGFVRVATATPQVEVANCKYNVEQMVESAHRLVKEGASIIVFPEMCITGYTCGDLFLQELLRRSAIDALRYFCQSTEHLPAIFIVGLPLEVSGRLFNVAAVVMEGSVQGVVPKTFIPNYNEFYEKRWFSSSVELPEQHILLFEKTVPIGRDLVFVTSFCRFAIEICEDLWSVLPPSTLHALHGAEVIFNLSASNETTGKAAYRGTLVTQQSARCISGYVYASAGMGESTTDIVFSGHSMIAENGVMLAESDRFLLNGSILMADLDVDRIRNERVKNKSFSRIEYPILSHLAYREIILPKLTFPSSRSLSRDVNPTPFVPGSEFSLSQRCDEIFSIQVAGLAKRLRHTGIGKCVIGISGGLDSTLALLVIVKTFDTLNIPRNNIHAITMPGFGTTNRTLLNALNLMSDLEVTAKEISIKKAVRLHFQDIGHDETLHDITYENSQARERTQILMDYANKVGALVIGTGDLSELALGWCTYNGDHSSMYAVNNGVPKTLVKTLVRWIADTHMSKSSAKILQDILDTPVSPELLPADEHGEITQQTEGIVGPYILHDFFLYYLLRHGFSPGKIYFLACHAFADSYSPELILKWLKVFFKRFFSQQFKRSCLPDGPKVGSINLSPRGDWRMPSDASWTLWEQEIEWIEQTNKDKT